MSSEKFQLLQKILEARYDFETCGGSSKYEARKRFETLVDKAIEGTNISKMALMEAIKYKMQEYRTERKKIESKRQNLR